MQGSFGSILVTKEGKEGGERGEEENGRREKGEEEGMGRERGYRRRIGIEEYREEEGEGKRGKRGGEKVEGEGEGRKKGGGTGGAPAIIHFKMVDLGEYGSYPENNVNISRPFLHVLILLHLYLKSNKYL